MGSMKSDESLPSLPSAVSTDSLPDSVATSSELAQCQTVHVDTAGSNGEPSLPPVSDEEMEFSDHCSLSSVSESELGLLEKTDHHVPGPAEMKKWLITLKAENHEKKHLANLAMELYSVPRVVPKATPEVAASPLGCFSFDVLNHWNFDIAELRALTLKMLRSGCIWFLYLSPPRTMFSELMRLFNYHRMSASDFDRRWQQAVQYVCHSMSCAKVQLRGKRRFMYEHPWKASSWGLPEVQEVQRHPNVFTATFDMCACGMVSPAGQPVKKRTTILTNDKWLADQLNQRQCPGNHTHRPIEGSELGFSMSKWCQKYPPPLVSLLAKAMQQK